MPRRRPRRDPWPHRIGALGACVLLLIGMGCSRRTSPADAKTDAAGAPRQESWAVVLRISQADRLDEQSRPRMHVRAGRMAQFEQDDSTYTLLRPHPDRLDERVTAYLFDESGDSSATLTADSLFYYGEEGRLVAHGDVVVVTQEQKTLQSDHLLWLERERTVHTPGFAVIITPEERIQGYALEADEDLDTYRLDRVTGQVTVEEE